MLKDAAVVVATLAGTWIAGSGVNAWKREHTGKRDIELCQDVIEDFYKAEQHIRTLRSPMSYPDVESAGRPGRDAETDEQRRNRDTHYVPLARFNGQQEFWAEFFSRQFRMRAIFGDQGKEPFDKIDEVLRRFRAAAVTRYQTFEQPGAERNAELWNNTDRVIWEVQNDDEINTSVRAAISDMERICMPVVRGEQRAGIVQKISAWFNKGKAA
ncbi:MAG: hypothetical protein ACK5KM_00735 [Hyphomicrobiaceae bacterium]